MQLLYFPAIISFSAYMLALYHVREGNFKPEPFSRLIWAAVSLLGLVLLLQGAPSIASVLLAVALFSGSLLLFLAALRHSTKSFTIEDVIAVVGSFACLGVWLVTDSPLLALLTLLTTDALAIMPTIHSFWRQPFFEDLWFWLLLSLGSITSFFILLQQGVFDAASILYVMYFAASQLSVAAVIAIRRLEMFNVLLQPAPKNKK